MDDVIDVGDVVVLTYRSLFRTGRKAVVKGAVTVVDDDVIAVRVGVREWFVPWGDVLDVHFA